MNDDGHTPKTCNYNICKADTDLPCPFMRDGKQPIDGEHLIKLAHSIRQHELDRHQYEWRQATAPSDLLFYCIHCLKIEKLAIP